MNPDLLDIAAARACLLRVIDREKLDGPCTAKAEEALLKLEAIEGILESEEPHYEPRKFA